MLAATRQGEQKYEQLGKRQMTITAKGIGLCDVLFRRELIGNELLKRRQEARNLA